MKKVIFLLAIVIAPLALSACCNCETEPTVVENHKLIVPPHFGQMPGGDN